MLKYSRRSFILFHNEAWCCQLAILDACFPILCMVITPYHSDNVLTHANGYSLLFMLQVDAVTSKWARSWCHVVICSSWVFKSSKDVSIWSLWIKLSTSVSTCTFRNSLLHHTYHHCQCSMTAWTWLKGHSITSKAYNVVFNVKTMHSNIHRS